MMILTFSVSPFASTRYTREWLVCAIRRERERERFDLPVVSPYQYESTKRVRTNNGAPVSPILMLCEGELSAR